MQVLVEMASSSETLQSPVPATDNDEGEKTFMAPPTGGNDGEKTIMAPPPAPPPVKDGEKTFTTPGEKTCTAPPLPLGSQSKAAIAKEGAEPQNAPAAVVRIPRNGFQGKRRNSLNIGFKHPVPFKRRRRVNSDCEPALPSNFLLGGNIFDPLNLNSLLDEEVNRALNAETPRSSPLPPRSRDPVEILIPKDPSDPLSLNREEGCELLLSPLKSGRKRHRHRHHPSTDGPANKGPEPGEPLPEELRPYELNTAINCREDDVRLPSLDNEDSDAAATATTTAATTSSRHRKRRRTSSKSEGGGGRHSSPEKGKTLASVAVKPPPPAPPKGGKKKARYQYGNYCRYYGYRNPSHTDDPRLAALRPEWFRGKAVLDIGCNVGHVTLCVAQKLGPARIVGMDVDGSLIHAARQNIRHYLSGTTKTGFPAGLVANRGPMAAPVLTKEEGVFPKNVLFVQGNYVMERDELVEVQHAEYDVILCLSVTKWVQLNWGDGGLKRMFRRMYRHLNPGGVLILEPQPWASYAKRKKLTDEIHKNYCRITLRPEQFASYLVSCEVGFSSYELLATPCSSSKGFQRPIYAFYKSGARAEASSSSSSSQPPRSAAPPRG